MADRPALTEVAESEQASALGFASVEKFLEARDRLRHGLAHIQKCWEEGLALNNAGLIEKYLSGRFAITLYFDASGIGAHEALRAAWADRDCRAPNAVVVLISNVPQGDGLGDEDGDQQSVFVTDVELVEGPQKSVRSFVRAYLIDDEGCDAGNGRLYGGVAAFATTSSTPGAGLAALDTKGRYKFLPRFPHRERESGVLPVQYLADYVIENGTEIVHRVTERQDHLRWQRIDRDNADFLAALRVVLNDHFAEIRFAVGIPDGLKLANVMVGPY